MEHIQSIFFNCKSFFHNMFIGVTKVQESTNRPSYEYSDESDKTFKGEVTYLNHLIGLINDNVKFNAKDFRNITIGSNVKGIAHKEYRDWKVILLEMMQDTPIQHQIREEDQLEWDEEVINTNLDVAEDTAVNSDEELDQCLEICCTIEAAFDNYIRNSNQQLFNISSCEKTYPIAKGDDVLIKYLSRKAEKWFVARAVEYLRIKTFLGQVTSHNNRGCIFNQKIFCENGIYENVSSKLENFYVVAVESNCDFACNWRAVSVSHVIKGTTSETFEFLPTVVVADKDKEVHKQHLPQIPSNVVRNCKPCNVITIDPVPNVELDNLYNSLVLPITVRFDIDSPITLTAISIRSTNSVQQLSFDESGSDENEFPIMFDGMCQYSFTISCTAKIIGATTERIVLSFDTMTVFKEVNFMVGSINTDSTAEQMLPIKGIKPYVGPRFIPKKLPAAVIPQWVSDAVVLKDLDSLLPTLGVPLDEKNYEKKMKLFLYLEEIQKTKQYQTHTIYKTTFWPERDYLTLNLLYMEEAVPFVVGDKVNVFPIAHEMLLLTGVYYEGYIHLVEGTKIFMKFSADAVSSISNQYCRVDFFCSRTPFRKCHMGIKLVTKTYGVCNLFPTALPPSVPPQTSYKEEGFAIVRNPMQQLPDEKFPTLEWVNPNLNAEQKSAIRNILAGCSRPLPYIIFGPPGTGKTITIVEAISQIFLLVPHSRILVVAPSNSASDLLSERLIQTELFGAHQLARLNGYNRGRASLPDSILEYCSDVTKTAEIIQCRVIICTNIVAASLYEEITHTDHFTHVFIDEAGHMTEAEISIPLSFVTRIDGQVILAGDPKQLGPTVMCPIAKRYGFGVSMLSRIICSPLYSADYTQELSLKMEKCNGNDSSIKSDLRSMYDARLVTLLVRSYRCTAPLIRLPSHMFYHNALIAQESRKEDELYRSWNMLPNKDFPILFYGIHGMCTQNLSDSRENLMEATIVAEIVKSLLDIGIQNKEIGVITPYRLQVKQIIVQLAMKNIRCVDVGTVEKFQGQERGAIILSTVRSYSPNASSNDAYNLGFVSSPERFNVSITRSKSLLVVVGDPTVLQLNYHWKALLDYCESQGGLVDTRRWGCI